jgi:3-oxoacyl-[acyl-carrier-protein] synthase II
MDGRRRVVITGLGALSALGANLSEFWEGLSSGRSGIRRITQFDPSDMPCQIAGEIPDFVAENYMDRKDARRVPRCCQVTLAAAMDAMKDAGFDSRAPDPERAGVFFGTAVGGVDKLEEGAAVLKEFGHSKVSPFMMPTGIPNIPAFMIAQHFQMLGPNATISTACATGTQAIGGGAEYIRHGAADLVIAGGVEAQIMAWSIAGFCAMRALPLSFNNNPTEASRPFDARREGFIFSEGCGVLVLEELEHLPFRGARPGRTRTHPLHALGIAGRESATRSSGLCQRPWHLHPLERPDGDQGNKSGLWRTCIQAGSQLD